MPLKYPNTHSSYKIMVVALLVSFIVAYQAVQLKPDAAIFQKWLYTFEEDSNDLKTYHPTSFEYPLGRGGPGMQFKKDGSFTLYELAPNDEHIQIHGIWKFISKGLFEITFPYGEKETFIIEIKELKPQKLIINVVRLHHVPIYK
jgi:hypothetical protein